MITVHLFSANQQISGCFLEILGSPLKCIPVFDCIATVEENRDILQHQLQTSQLGFFFVDRNLFNCCTLPRQLQNALSRFLHGVGGKRVQDHRHYRSSCRKDGRPNISFHRFCREFQQLMPKSSSGPGVGNMSSLHSKLQRSSARTVA